MVPYGDSVFKGHIIERVIRVTSVDTHRRAGANNTHRDTQRVRERLEAYVASKDCGFKLSVDQLQRPHFAIS